MKGTITEIQRFCVSDGPGIRSTVFLKGCPLRCAWCHNPETWRAQPQLMWAPARCTGCGACAHICPAKLALPQGFKACPRPGCALCACACPHEALVKCGYTISPEELADKVAADRDYYEMSGGGVTFSGGEPLAQADFLLAALKLLRADGLHTAVETCGYAPAALFEQVMAATDLLLFDLKHTDPAVHERFTGQDNGLILQNLRKALAGGRVWARIPYIPGVTDCGQGWGDILRAIRDPAPPERVEILPYHGMGADKAAALGQAVGYVPPPGAFEAEMRGLRDFLAANGLDAEIV